MSGDADRFMCPDEGCGLVEEYGVGAQREVRDARKHLISLGYLRALPSYPPEPFDSRWECARCGRVWRMTDHERGQLWFTCESKQ